jgi:hypothetical protein
VIFVYGYKIKPIKDGQFFIPYLAVVDLMRAVICSLVGPEKRNLSNRRHSFLDLH